jgi:TonB family protein
MLGMAVVLHALGLAVAAQIDWGVSVIEAPKHAAADGDGQDATLDIDPACLLDEALVSGATASLCLPPAGSDRDACLAAAVKSLTNGRLACAEAARPLDVTMLEPTALQPGAVVDEEEKKKEEEKKLEEERKDEEDPNKMGQVVDIAKPTVEEKNPDAEKLAEYDSKVEHETKHMGAPAPSPGVYSSQPGKNPEVAPQPMPMPEPPASTKPRGQEGVLAMRGSGEKPTPGSQQTQTPGDTEGFKAEGGDLQKKGDGPQMTQTEPGGGGQPGDANGAPPVPSMKQLRPSEGALKGAGVGSYDALDDVDEGQDTLLNTKRWKYASFFNRVKRAVAQNWHPAEVWSMRDPTGKIYGTKDRLTVLKVSLKPDGSLANVMIVQPCGVDFLDDEAVHAFKEAQPFPHPPGGLVDKDSNLITFRFGFQFNISDGSGWKIFRYE